MPTLNWIGKEAVVKHHKEVPFRLLEPVPELSCGDGAASGNLIVQGDNLHALKALLPRYAGQVKCIYIDPLSKTGNEGWAYNDNVNSLEFPRWLGEVAALRHLMDEVFGPRNIISTFVWRKADNPNDNKVALTPDHEFVIGYALNRERLKLAPMSALGIVEADGRTDDSGHRYRDRLLKKNGRNSLRRDRTTMYFGLTAPDGNDAYPIHDNGEEARWSMGKDGIARHVAADTLICKQRERHGRQVWEPHTCEFAPENPVRPYPSIWADLPTMQQAQSSLRDVFDD